MNAMSPLRNERGIALVTSLLLTLIALAIILALLYYVSQGIKMSAAHKRYANSLEASYGGVEVFTQQVIPAVLNGTVIPSLFDVAPTNPSGSFQPSGCFQFKLNNPTSMWGSSCNSHETSSDPSDSPDATIKLKGLPLQPGFHIYTKITDTVLGNSDSSGLDLGLIDNAAGVAYGNAGVSPKHMPSVYRIEVQGERENNPTEKARLSVLYVY